MRVAPLQPKGIVFEEVFVQAVPGEHSNLIPAQDFDFQGVKIICEVGHGDVASENGKQSDDSMLISVRFQIPNTDGKPCPYKINVAVTGIFKWLDKTTSRVQRRDLTVINGASILYGAIREMILTVTSRSMPGALLLPGFSFMDDKPSKTDGVPSSDVIEHNIEPVKKIRSRVVSRKKEEKNS